MPPKKMPPKDSKTFSVDEVAALLAASGATIGGSCYTVMGKIDKSRTKSGYEHLFREVKARAKEISDLIDSGEIDGMKAKAPGKRNTSSASPTKAPAKAKGNANGEKEAPKRGRKARSEESPDADDEGGTKKKVKTEEVDGEGEADAPAVENDPD